MAFGNVRLSCRVLGLSQWGVGQKERDRGREGEKGRGGRRETGRGGVG